MLKYKKINEERFKAIKSVLEASPLSNVEVGNIFSNAPGTIATIRNSKTFKEYMNTVGAASERKRQWRAKSLPSTPSVSASDIADEPPKYVTEFDFSDIHEKLDLVLARLDVLLDIFEEKTVTTLSVGNPGTVDAIAQAEPTPRGDYMAKPKQPWFKRK